MPALIKAVERNLDGLFLLEWKRRAPAKRSRRASVGGWLHSHHRRWQVLYGECRNFFGPVLDVRSCGPLRRDDSAGGKREQQLQHWLTAYARRLEHYCCQAPYQWFNFYDFWSA